MLLSPIGDRQGRLGSRRRRLPHAVAFVPVNSVDGGKGISPASMRVEDQAQVAASVDPDDLEALSLAWRVGLRLGRAGWRTVDDAKLWSHRAVRRPSICGACEQLRDLGMQAQRPKRPIIHGDSHSRPMAGPLRLCAQTGGARVPGPGSPCACRHTTPSELRHNATALP